MRIHRIYGTSFCLTNFFTWLRDDVLYKYEYNSLWDYWSDCHKMFFNVGETYGTIYGTITTVHKFETVLGGYTFSSKHLKITSFSVEKLVIKILNVRIVCDWCVDNYVDNDLTYRNDN